MRDGTAKLLSSAHATLFRMTGGRVGRRLVSNDMLLLTTTGRTSGVDHTIPLLFLRDGDRIVVFASWGGRDHHPEWYLNLQADPRAEVSVAGTQYAVVATTAAEAERAMWWQRATDAYAGYAEYQARTERLIPVVLLDPA